jgi:hypothetical protein
VTSQQKQATHHSALHSMALREKSLQHDGVRLFAPRNNGQNEGKKVSTWEGLNWMELHGPFPKHK